MRIDDNVFSKDQVHHLLYQQLEGVQMSLQKHQEEVQTLLVPLQKELDKQGTETPEQVPMN